VDGHPEIEVCRFPGFAALEADWRALEARAAGQFSFFQSWTWVGCLAEDRFTDPILLRASRAGNTVGLALFNRRHRTLWLAESGDPILDASFVEHNAPLTAGEPTAVLALLQAVWRVPGVRRLVLSGVAENLPAAAGGHVLRRQLRPAPFVDLATVRAAGGDHLATISANTRQQIRRSLRLLAARGPLHLSHPASLAEAEQWFTALVALHGQSWRRRGGVGAFAQPWIRRFHAALLPRVFARGELDLVRLAAGEMAIGYLYNFRLNGRVYAYQSGLAERLEAPQEKPGLCLHALAIREAAGRGDQVYDFLAGDARYKRSLASNSVALVWAELARPDLRGRLLAHGSTALRRVLRRD
jgi:CelD/BcsL family acetyltransferase involved in cellulose biosynthesis